MGLDAALAALWILSFSAADAPGRAAPETREADYFGWRIAYESAGEGPVTIVFVHGWSCDRSVWEHQADALAGRYRVITIDLLGHGASDKPEVHYTMALFARSVAAVLDHIGVQRAILVGHSNGAPVVRQFYRLFPESTAGLVVVDGTLRPLFTDPAQIEAFIAPLRGPDYRERAGEFIGSLLPETLDESERARLREVVLSTPQHVMVGGFEAANDPAIWAQDPIEVPLLVVLARSPFWTDDYEAFVRELAPQVEYHVWDGVSHFLMLDEPDEFNALLADFADRVFSR